MLPPLISVQDRVVIQWLFPVAGSFPVLHPHIWAVVWKTSCQLMPELGSGHFFFIEKRAKSAAIIKNLPTVSIHVTVAYFTALPVSKTMLATIPTLPVTLVPVSESFFNLINSEPISGSSLGRNYSLDVVIKIYFEQSRPGMFLIALRAIGTFGIEDGVINSHCTSTPLKFLIQTTSSSRWGRNDRRNGAVKVAGTWRFWFRYKVE